MQAMIRLDAVLAMFTDLDSVEVVSWIERRWVQPEPATPNSSSRSAS